MSQQASNEYGFYSNVNPEVEVCRAHLHREHRQHRSHGHRVEAITWEPRTARPDVDSCLVGWIGSVLDDVGEVPDDQSSHPIGPVEDAHHADVGVPSGTGGEQGGSGVRSGAGSDPDHPPAVLVGVRRGFGHPAGDVKGFEDVRPGSLREVEPDVDQTDGP